MVNCPICELTQVTPPTLCVCGYDYKEQGVVEKDKEKLRSYYAPLKQRSNWSKRVRFVRNFHKTQQDKYGPSTQGAYGNWGIRRTAKWLGETITNIPDFLNLASAVDQYPELLECANLSQAKRRYAKLISVDKLLERYSKTFESESDLQNHMESFWDTIPFCKNWKFQGAKVNAEKAGQIDLLAYNSEKGTWLVIELKKDVSPDKTVGQILRYMGWVKVNRANKHEDVKGLIISGFPPDRNITLALTVTSNIDQKLYYLSENNEVKFMEDQTAENLLALDRLSTEQLLEFIKKNMAEVKHFE